MDIRIEKTDRAIEKAFMELRARQPLEKIRIKDLCTLAKVNKSTFYAHYEDIYELSSRLENKLIHVILDSVPNVGLTAAHTEQLTRELIHAFVQHQEAVNILFSGGQRPHLCSGPRPGHPAFLLRAGLLLCLCQQQRPDGRGTSGRSAGCDRQSGAKPEPMTES